MFTSKYFELGKVVASRAVYETIKANERFNLEAMLAIKRYCVKDWGATCEEDSALNDTAVSTGDNRIFAVYETCKGNIWIITEADRSSTTILFPQDY